MSDDIRAMFDSAGTNAPGRGASDPISTFKKAARAQITRAEDTLGKKTIKTPALNWFKSRNGEYVVQLGKKPIPVGKHSHWSASDLDAVIRLFNGAIKLADTDAEFQAAIVKAAKEASARKATLKNAVSITAPAAVKKTRKAKAKA